MALRFFMAIAILSSWLGAPQAPSAEVATPEGEEAVARLEALAELDRRVAQVGFRLAVASVDLCPGDLPISGVLTHRPSDYGPRLRPAFSGLSDTQSVAIVVPGSPAHIAGLQEGDVILDAPAADLGLSSAKASGRGVWRVRRGERSLEFAFQPFTACAALPRVETATQLFARSSPTNGTLTVSSALVEFTRSDHELAALLGHELAHIALRRAEATGRFHAGGRAPEALADEWGIYFAARAGYAPHAAAEMLARLARAKGGWAFRDHRHQPLVTRARRLSLTAEGITALQAKGQVLVPPGLRSRPGRSAPSAIGQAQPKR